MANVSTYLNYDITKLQYQDGWVTDQRIVSSKLSCSRFLIPNTQNTTRVTPSVLNTWRKVDVIIVFYFYLFLRENVICSFLEESVCGRDPTHPTHLLPSPPPLPEIRFQNVHRLSRAKFGGEAHVQQAAAATKLASSSSSYTTCVVSL